jgi:REP element-mobilizing transposase RayT
MPQKIEHIQHGKHYHIYNRGINGEKIFREPNNYEHFLRVYEKYVDPVAETFAWCMMPNHFHFLVRIKEKEEAVDSSNPARVRPPVRITLNCFTGKNMRKKKLKNL